MRGEEHKGMEKVKSDEEVRSIEGGRVDGLKKYEG